MTPKSPLQQQLETLLDGFSNDGLLAQARNKKLTEHHFRQSQACFVVALTSFHPDISAEIADEICHTLGENFAFKRRGLKENTTDANRNAERQDDVTGQQTASFTLDLMRAAMESIVASKSPLITSESRQFLEQRLNAA